jgi:hypothetical protein
VLRAVSPPCIPPSKRPPRAPGILLRSRSLAQLSGSAPWLLGSLGTVLLDIVIFLQVPALALGPPSSLHPWLLAPLGATALLVMPDAVVYLEMHDPADPGTPSPGTLTSSVV